MNIPKTLAHLESTLQERGPLETADELVSLLRSQGQFRELFEALKMRNRIALGLPAVAEEGDPVVYGPTLDQLERGLIDACREVGLALLKQGNLQEGWMYMRPVGDNQAAAQAISKLPVTHENLDEFLQFLVHEGIDIARGTALSLQLRGTCNTITLLESVVSMRGRIDQQLGVKQLVRHVHAELHAGLVSDIRRREGQPPSESGIQEILTARPGLLRDGSYHMDTTHIASTVRFARVLDDHDSIQLAVDLAEYGRQLHPQYQYPGDEPFIDLYASSAAFFRALLGHHVDQALRLFQQRAESLDTQEHGTIAIETYADLLARVGRPAEAIRVLIQRMPAGMRPCGVAPSLLELSTQAGNYDAMRQHAANRHDTIGFAAALLQAATKSTKDPAHGRGQN